MATVILAIGDNALRSLCQNALGEAGHTPVAVSRPLQALGTTIKVLPDAMLIDGTSLGRDTMTVWRGRSTAGLGIEHPSLGASLPLPVTGRQVVDLVERLVGSPPVTIVLTLDAGRRVAGANGREVDLTRTEFQLLQALYGHRGREISQEEALEAAWGQGDWSGNVAVLRAHMRNLRLKLAQVGLPNAVRSLRGRGYALVV
jgi:DNA-binding response OmpR family regulator